MSKDFYSKQYLVNCVKPYGNRNCEGYTTPNYITNDGNRTDLRHVFCLPLILALSYLFFSKFFYILYVYYFINRERLQTTTHLRKIA